MLCAVRIDARCVQQRFATKSMSAFSRTIQRCRSLDSGESSSVLRQSHICDWGTCQGRKTHQIAKTPRPAATVSIRPLPYPEFFAANSINVPAIASLGFEMHAICLGATGHGFKATETLEIRTTDRKFSYRQSSLAHSFPLDSDDGSRAGWSTFDHR